MSGYTDSGVETWYKELKTKAAFELKCDENALTFVQLSEGSLAPVGVTGCGNQATYLVASGQWIMNTTSVK